MFFPNLHNYILSQVKSIGQMFYLRDIAQLFVGDFGLPNLHVDVAMRVAVDPVINPRIRDIVAQLHRKSAVDFTALKFFSRATLRRHMVGEHNLRLCRAFSNRLFDKSQTLLMLSVEIV